MKDADVNCPLKKAMSPVASSFQSHVNSEPPRGRVGNRLCGKER